MSLFAAPPPPHQGVLRRIWPWEHAAYAEHLLRLDPSDRMARFLGALSDDAVRRHAQTALAAGRVIGWRQDGALRGAVEMRLAGETAELAVSVEAAYRRQGVGAALMGRAVRAARNRGARELAAHTTAGNWPMIALGAKFKARYARDNLQVTGVVRPRRATPISLWVELIEEEASLAAWAMEAAAQRALEAGFLKPAPDRPNPDHTDVEHQRSA